MSIISTTASRRSSLSEQPAPNIKYKQIFQTSSIWGYTPQQRIRADNCFKQELSLKLLRTINGTKWQNGSYLFRVGKQNKDQRFSQVFMDFFREMRGGDPLAIKASISLADRFRGYSDVSRSEEHTIDGGDFSDIQTVYYSPTQRVIDELKQILEDEYGMQGQFLDVLNLAGRKLGDQFSLNTRDTAFYGFPMISRIFPRCVDTLREIFNSLLISKWLKNDIDGVKLYIDENDYIDRLIPINDIEEAISLWTAAKYYGDQQRLRDIQLSKKHWNDLKDDMSGIAISGGLSFITGNPGFVIGKAAQTTMNVIGNKVDPEGKDQSVQVLKLFGGVGLGAVMGSNPWDLGTSLGVDLMDLATRGDKTGKRESALRNLGGSALKGVLTADKKKLICQILGGAVAEAANQLPETTEDTPLDVRIARALLTNGDVQAHYIKGYVDKHFKEDPKPKLEEQEKYPKQVLTEIETEQPQIQAEPEMQDKAKYLHLLAEEKTLEANLQKAKNDLTEPQHILNEKQQVVDYRNERVNHYNKKGGNKAYEKGLKQKEKGYTAVQERNVAQHNVNKKTDVVVDLAGKLEANRLAQAEASAPKHINPPDSKIHIIADQKTKKNHHPHYFDDNGQKQSLGKYGNADDARFISGAFTKFETERFSQESRCFDGQRQLVESGTSIDDVPQMPTLETPTFERNNADKNFQKLQETRIRNEKRVQEYLKQIEQLVGKPITAQGLTKTQINQISQQIAPKIKEIKQHGFWFNAWRAPGRALKWLDNHGVSLSVNVDYSMPLYQTKTPSTTPSYTGSYGYDLPKREPIISSTWENVQQMVSGQVFQANMAYQSPVQQPTLDYQQFWGQGLANNVQMPLTDWNGLGRNDQTLCKTLQGVSNREMQMAGLSPNEIIKAIPVPIKRDIDTWVKNFVQEIKDNPIKSKKDMAVCLILGAKKVLVVAIQAFEQPSLKAKPNSFGLMEVSDRCDRWVAQKLDVSLDSSHAKVGMLIGEIAMPMPFMGGLKPCMKVGEEAFAFMRQSARLMRPQPLMDRMLAFPQGFSNGVRAIEALQQPVYRSGLVGEKAIQQARKAVNLPAWKKMSIDMKHITSGHISKGWRTMCEGNKKTLFPEGFSESQVEKIIRQAYRNGKKVRGRGDKAVVVGEYEGVKVEMYVNIKEKIIETAYPKK